MSPHNTDMDNKPERSNWPVHSLAILCNTLQAGLSGLYVTTHSVIITALATGMIALLALCVVVTSR
nr:hypothetical protein [Kibdelosporangium sp. MJ126-NF4]